MKKFILLLLLIFTIYTGAFGESTPPPESDNSKSVNQCVTFDLAEEILSALVGGAIGIPIEYQNLFLGRFGISAGIAPFVLLGESPLIPDYSELVLAVGPICYFKNKGIDGLFIRLRGICDLTGAGITDTLNLNSGVNFGAEMHFGYTFLLPMKNYPDVYNVFIPEVGFRYINNQKLAFNWGFSMGTGF